MRGVGRPGPKLDPEVADAGDRIGVRGGGRGKDGYARAGGVSESESDESDHCEYVGLALISSGSPHVTRRSSRAATRSKGSLFVCARWVGWAGAERDLR